MAFHGAVSGCEDELPQPAGRNASAMVDGRVGVAVTEEDAKHAGCAGTGRRRGGGPPGEADSRSGLVDAGEFFVWSRHGSRCFPMPLSGGRTGTPMLHYRGSGGAVAGTLHHAQELGPGTNGVVALIGHDT